MAHGKSRILVIDDDLAIAELIRDILAKPDVDIELAGNAAEGQASLSAAHFDLLLLDLKLPDGNGLEILAGLRAEGNTIPVVMMSTLTDKSYRIRAQELGARAFLSKPFTPGLLLETVRSALTPLPPKAA